MARKKTGFETTANGVRRRRVGTDVWELEQGGYTARARVRTAAVSGERAEVFPKGTPLHEVLAWQEKAKAQIRKGSPSVGRTLPSYDECWRDVLERKSLMAGQGERLIKSEKTRETFEDANNILVRYFAEVRVDRVDLITKSHTMGLGPWLTAQTYDPSCKRGKDRKGNVKPPGPTKLVAGTRVKFTDPARPAPVSAVVVIAKGSGVTVTVNGTERRIARTSVVEALPPDVPLLAPRRYSNAFKNIVLRTYRTVMNAAVNEHDLAKNPTTKMAFFPDTKIKGNALRDKALRRRFEAMWFKMYEQSFAMFVLGCFVGGRKSTLYPIRRSGPDRDWIPETGELVLRRSLVTKQSANEQIKTEEPLTYLLPEEINDWLKWHVRTQLTTQAQRESELLFPGIDGRFRGTTFLDKHFENVSVALGGERFTSKVMRRTAEQVMDSGGVDAEERRHHLGWTQVTTQGRYGAQDPKTLRTRGRKVVDLFGFRPAPGAAKKER